MEMDMDETNPLFGSGAFKPSLTAITEDDREASSYYRDGQSVSGHANHIESKSSSSSHVQQQARTPVTAPGKGPTRSELPQDSPTKSQNNNSSPKGESSKRLSSQLPRMPSLSRLIRTKSGRVLKQGSDLEEKEEESDEGQASTVQKKRASILGGLFKTASSPSIA